MRDLTTGTVYKRILFFALPIFAGQFLQQLYNVIDSIIVGKFVGKEALAAVGNSFPVIFALISLIIGIVSGTTILIAQYYGARQMENVQKAIDTLYTFVAVISLILPVVAIYFSHDIFVLIKLPEEIIPLAQSYFNIFIGGMILLFGFNSTNGILRGLGDSMTPLFFVVIATVFNVALDLLFVLVFKWGIKGVAYATVISQGIGFISSLIYLNRHHKVFRFSLFHINFDWAVLRKSLKVGLPLGFHHISVALGLTAILWIVNAFGTDVIAAYTAGGRIGALAGLPPMVFGTALATFTGQNIGAGKMYRVKEGLKSTLVMALSIAMFFTIVIFTFREDIISLFTNDAHIIAIGAEYLSIICWFWIVFATMFSVNGLIQGAGDTFIPMIIAVLSIVIRVIAAYYLSRVYGEVAIWWSFPISWTISMMLGVGYYFTGLWKRKALVQQTASN